MQARFFIFTILSLLTFPTLSTPGFSQCVDWDYVPPSRIVSGINTSSDDIVELVQDNYAIVFDRYGSNLYDVSDVANPVWIDQWYSSAKDFATVGNVGYLASGGASSFVTLDMTDVTLPTTMSYRNASLDRFCVDGLHVFGVSTPDLDGFPTYFKVLDVSDSSTIPSLATLTVPGKLFDVTMDGGYVFGAHQTSGLIVIDVIDPAAPAVVDSLSLAGPAELIEFHGDHVFLAGASAIYCINVTSPTAPILTCSLTAPAPVTSLSFTDDRMFATLENAGVLVIDISNPEDLSITNQFLTDRNMRDTAVDGEFLFALGEWQSGRDNFFVANIRNPDVPLQTMPQIIGQTPIVAVDAKKAGDFAFVASSYKGFYTVDISDPANPAKVDSVATSNWATGVELVGTYCYVAQGSSILVFDVSDPTAVVLVGEVTTPGAAKGLAVSGNIAAVADYVGYAILDISDPVNPIVLYGHTEPLDEVGEGVAIQGSYAYLAGYHGLQAIDISIPDSAPIISTLDLGSTARGVCTDGDFAYVAAGDLYIVDISDPTSLQFVSSAAVGNAYDVDIASGIVYVADFYQGITAFDVSDPTQPIVVGMLPTSSGNWKLTAYEDMILVPNAGGGLLLSHPHCLSDPDCNSNGLDDQYEILVHPSLDFNNDLIIDNCQQGQGLSQVPGAGTALIVLNQAYPNPFNPRTVISFDLPQPTVANLRVYDLGGHLIARLLDGTRVPQGRNKFVWDGRDQRGRTVPAGVYFYRLDAPGFSDTKKMLLLK